MKATLAHLTARPVLAAFAGLGLVIGLAAGPLTEMVTDFDRIATSREALARAGTAASRPPVPAPLAAVGADAMLAAFRSRLEALAANRAAVIDRTEIEPDPDRPTLPRLRATLRGTAEGLHGLLHALETESPLIAVEEAGIGIERPADADLGRPTLMHLALTTRGVLLPVEPEPRGTMSGTKP